MEDLDERLPLNVNDLIEKLNKIFPERCARVDQTLNEIMYEAGQRSVIYWLLELQARENNNINKDE